MEYYVDVNGNYLGAFSEGNPSIPEDAIQVSGPPNDGRQIWNGAAWGILDIAITNKIDIEVLEASVTPRRLREAILTAEGKAWLTAIEAQINVKRSV